MTTQPTCADRIEAQAASRLGGIANVIDAMRDPEDVSEDTLLELGADELDVDSLPDRASEYLLQLPLAVEVRRVVRIDLSTGGPADWLEVHLDGDNDPARVEYHFADWFDHASKVLEEPEYDAAVAFAEHVTGGFYFE